MGIRGVNPGRDATFIVAVSEGRLDRLDDRVRVGQHYEFTQGLVLNLRPKEQVNPIPHGTRTVAERIRFVQGAGPLVTRAGGCGRFG